MYTVIFDTNLLLDFFVFKEPSTECFWRSALNKDFLVCTDAAALDELKDVLQRPQFKCSAQDAENILREYLSVALLKEENTKSCALCRDPLDQKFLDLAVSIAPCILITKDKLVLKCAGKLKKENVLILNPDKARKLLFAEAQKKTD